MKGNFNHMLVHTSGYWRLVTRRRSGLQTGRSNTNTVQRSVCRVSAHLSTVDSTSSERASGSDSFRLLSFNKSCSCGQMWPEKEDRLTWSVFLMVNNRDNTKFTDPPTLNTHYLLPCIEFKYCSLFIRSELLRSMSPKRPHIKLFIYKTLTVKASKYTCVYYYYYLIMWLK